MKRIVTIISTILLTFCFAAEASAQTNWTPTQSNGGILSGNYILRSDVTLQNTIEINAGTSLTIDLNGHKITFPSGRGRVFLCKGELTIKDSSSGKTGVITGGVGDRGGFVYLIGKFNFLGGTIQNAHAEEGAQSDGENAYTNGVGGAVYVQYGAEFIMDGGNIENCSTSGDNTKGREYAHTGRIPFMGGAVFINASGGNGGKFHFKSGTISHCSSGAGGAVCVHVAQSSAGSGEFIMEGGEITDCGGYYSFGDYGGGAVFVSGKISNTIRNIGKFYMSGGSIKNGNATRGGGVYVKGEFHMSGGSIEDCVATRTNLENGTKENIYTNGTGGGVFVDCGGYFAMEGGTIRNCSTSIKTEQIWIDGSTYFPGMGGGVFVSAYAASTASNISDLNDHRYRGRFWFNKGLIEDCHSGVGGGVCVHTTVTRNITGANGRFTMESGAEIRNCKSWYPPGNAQYGGGGVYIAGNGKLDGGLKGVFNMNGGRITGCSAVCNGGGIKCNGEMYMADGCVVDSCKCEGGKTDTDYYSQAYGGGIHLYNATFVMSGGKIEYNTAFSAGGVMAWGTKCVFTMNGANAIISNNVVTGVHGSGNGGGVYVQEATFHFNHGTITQNKADRYGGGININETATLNLNGVCNITSNEASAGGGISQEAGGCVIDIKSNGVLIANNQAIANEEIVGTTANGQGGGILIEKGTFRMSTGIIRGNTASRNGGGVSCYVSRIVGDVTAEITGGEISGNSAGISGGGIDLYADKDNGSDKNNVVVNLTGGRLLSNSAQNGGGIYVGINTANSTATMTINSSYTASTIYGNTATENGGAIGLNNGTVAITSGNFSNNTAGRGGAIYLGSGNMTLNNISIHENTATNSGGGVYLANGKLTIEGSDKNKICNNTANSTGGGIHIQNGKLEMTKCLVQENTATYGGGVCVNNSDATTINLLNSAITFEKNTATTAGGGMAVLGPITLNFAGSFQYNSANNGGGILVAQGATLNYKGGMIRYNHATGTSTGINTGYKGTANEIHGFGGGVFVGAYSKLQFNVTDGGLGFYGNDAKTGGDDIFANGEGTDVLLPVVGDMELTGFDIPVAKNGIFWVEDYMTNDVKYNLGPHILGDTHSSIRYQDALKSAAYIGRLDDDETYYGLNKNKYLSLALGYELLFVRIIKQGLDPGDAVIVNLSYSQNGKTEGSDWVPYQKALLVGPESGDASVVVALPPNAWKFEEETAWSANYTATNSIETRKFDNQQQVTDVTFINTKKDKGQITVHDEDNVENRMSPTS